MDGQVVARAPRARRICFDARSTGKLCLITFSGVSYARLMNCGVQTSDVD